MSLLLLFFFKPSFTDSVFYFRFHDSVSSIISCLGDEAKKKNTPDRRLVTVNSFVLFAWRRIAKRFFWLVTNNGALSFLHHKNMRTSAWDRGIK